MNWYPICDWSPCGKRAKFRDPGLGVNWCGQLRCADFLLWTHAGYMVFPVKVRWHRITWPRLLQWAAASSLRFLAEFSRQLLLALARIVAGSWWKGPESLDYEITLSDRET